MPNQKRKKCQICGQLFEDSELYEYRGFIACEEHFDSLIMQVDDKRQEVMEVTNAAILSQRNGEFVNNRSKYYLGNVAKDGLPIIKVKEPQVLKDYENRKMAR